MKHLRSSSYDFSRVVLKKVKKLQCKVIKKLQARQKHKKKVRARINKVAIIIQTLIVVAMARF